VSLKLQIVLFAFCLETEGEKKIFFVSALIILKSS